MYRWATPRPCPLPGLVAIIISPVSSTKAMTNSFPRHSGSVCRVISSRLCRRNDGNSLQFSIITKTTFQPNHPKCGPGWWTSLWRGNGCGSCDDDHALQTGLVWLSWILSWLITLARSDHPESVNLPSPAGLPLIDKHPTTSRPQ